MVQAITLHGVWKAWTHFAVTYELVVLAKVFRKLSPRLVHFARHSNVKVACFEGTSHVAQLD